MAEPLLSHDVFFSLHDASAFNKARLVAACKKYLTSHPGVVFFSAGTLAEELCRPVNDVAFDVALHIVFENQAAHDAYQTAPRHHAFADECKALWKQVRVFDSLVERA